MDLYHAADKLIDEELDYVQGSRWLREGRRENMTFREQFLR